MKGKIASRIFVLIVLTAVVGIAGIRAKYRAEIVVEESVQFEAELAESVTLTEHVIERNDDGSYILTERINTAGENSYMVMPGVNLPKDPAFTITNKSSIPAFLYVEVVKSNTFPDTVTYSITSEWEELSITGPNGGAVYVYEAELPTSGTIQILENNELKISQNYHETEFELDFYGYMTQEIDGKNKEEVFTACFLTTQ